MNRRLFHLRTLSLGLFALAFAACQGTPGPTDVSGSGYETTTIDGVQLLNTPRSMRLRPAGLDMKVIGPAGGFVETDGGRLTIPAGALNFPVTIVEHGKEAPHYRYRFGPSGLQFNQPAMLAIEIDEDDLEDMGIGTDRLRIAGGNDLGTDWSIIGGTYHPELGAVVVPIEHFSQYSLCVD